MEDHSNKKILIAYFSRRGQNYLNGDIVDLAVGNTEVVARMIQAQAGGDLFEIDTVKLYPKDYNETTKVAMEEKRSNFRPELTATVKNMEEYDTIILGYPNWWGTFPMAVFTFLESFDYSGKTILPFCTHEASGLGVSERDIRRICPQAKVLSGLALRGGSAKTASDVIRNWIKNSKI
jgi:flavodoxin